MRNFIFNQNQVVSVVIAAYGQAEYILQSLDSVYTQTFKDYELIVAGVQ